MAAITDSAGREAPIPVGILETVIRAASLITARPNISDCVLANVQVIGSWVGEAGSQEDLQLREMCLRRHYMNLVEPISAGELTGYTDNPDAFLHGARELYDYCATARGSRLNGQAV